MEFLHAAEAPGSPYHRTFHSQARPAPGGERPKMVVGLIAVRPPACMQILN